MWNRCLFSLLFLMMKRIFKTFCRVSTIASLSTLVSYLLLIRALKLWFNMLCAHLCSVGLHNSKDSPCLFLGNLIEGWSPRIQGMIGAPGDEASQSSYRSELTELYCIILTVTKLCSFYSIDNGSIMVSCDNLLASEQAFGENDISLADPSYDLLLAIRCLLSISKVK